MKNREEVYIKKEFPKNKPKHRGFYITDYNGDFENSVVEWFGQGNEGFCFINSSGGIIDKKITWFFEKTTLEEIVENKNLYTKEDLESAFVQGALTDLFNTWRISEKDMAKEKFVQWFKEFKK